MSEQSPRIECQDCGVTLRTLTPSEAQTVADRPYDFVFYCRSCKEERQWITA